jgi:hypothetical protein
MALIASSSAPRHPIVLPALDAKEAGMSLSLSPSLSHTAWLGPIVSIPGIQASKDGCWSLVHEVRRRSSSAHNNNLSAMCPPDALFDPGHLADPVARVVVQSCPTRCVVTRAPVACNNNDSN